MFDIHCLGVPWHFCTEFAPPINAVRVFGGQGLHLLDPMVSAYVSAAHAEQESGFSRPFGEWVPAWHLAAKY